MSIDVLFQRIAGIDSATQVQIVVNYPKAQALATTNHQLKGAQRSPGHACDLSLRCTLQDVAYAAMTFRCLAIDAYDVIHAGYGQLKDMHVPCNVPHRTVYPVSIIDWPLIGTKD